MKENLSFIDGFGLSNAPCLVTKPVWEAEFSVAHLLCPLQAGEPQLVCMPKLDCFFLMLYLDDTRHCDVVQGGSDTAVRLFSKGTICLVDLADGPSIRLHETLHALAFLIPYNLLKEVSEFSKTAGAKSLRCLRGEKDEVMWSLGKALLPLFSQPQNQRFGVFGHLAVAVCAHLLHLHGDVSDVPSDASTLVLSERQERAATEFMAKHFQDDLDVRMIARVVGLSESDFVKAFEHATSKSPLEWLTDHRVTLAKRYLAEHDHTLSEIAALSGFQNIDRFHDDFTRSTGFSPLRWRNRWLN